MRKRIHFALANLISQYHSDLRILPGLVSRGDRPLQNEPFPEIVPSLSVTISLPLRGCVNKHIVPGIIFWRASCHDCPAKRCCVSTVGWSMNRWAASTKQQPKSSGSAAERSKDTLIPTRQPSSTQAIPARPESRSSPKPR